ncbi:MAG: hypothetical protein EBU33_06735, partial [Sphingobacteriia bacterium]|nr:hypothetical protein [Sphingobacteriia bacterium]
MANVDTGSVLLYNPNTGMVGPSLVPFQGSTGTSGSSGPLPTISYNISITPQVISPSVQTTIIFDTLDTTNRVGTSVIVYDTTTGYITNNGSQSINILVTGYLTWDQSQSNCDYIIYGQRLSDSLKYGYQTIISTSNETPRRNFSFNAIVPVGDSITLQVYHDDVGSVNIIDGQLIVTQMDYILGPTGFTGPVGQSGAMPMLLAIITNYPTISGSTVVDPIIFDSISYNNLTSLSFDNT